MYNVTISRVRVTIVEVEEATFKTYSECVFLALAFENALRTRHIVLPGSTMFFQLTS
jgi:hypothetical protein